MSGRPHSAIIKRNVKADENTFDKDNNAATLGGVAVAHIDGGRHQTKEFELFQPTFSGISNATLKAIYIRLADKSHVDGNTM